MMNVFFSRKDLPFLWSRENKLVQVGAFGFRGYFSTYYGSRPLKIYLDYKVDEVFPYFSMSINRSMSITKKKAVFS